MQKRIFWNFAGVILICIVVLALSFGVLFFRAAQTHERAAIRDKAYLVAGILNHDAFVPNLTSGGTRLTIISPDGWVLSDTHAGTDFTVNRGDRLEFIQAIAYGSGEAIRRSDTFGAETFYYAIRLQDGSVLRLSRTLYSLGEVFTSTLPALIVVTIIILVLAHVTAHRLTRKIIKPLSEVDFETTTVSAEFLYEELWPYIKKIEHQKHEISSQLMTLRTRAETIEAIIANMREGLVILDEKGLVMAVNKSVLDIFGRTKDIIQKNIQHIYRDPEFAQTVKKCLAGAHLETSITRNDRVYNVYLNPVISNDTFSAKTVPHSPYEDSANLQDCCGADMALFYRKKYESSHGAIIFFLDTTEQFKAETQRREFTANVSHELKTPLTTISALSEMIANGMIKPEDVSTYSSKISGHTQRLINIIEDIIRLSEFDEKKAEKNFDIFDIYELAKSVITALHEKATERSVAIKLEGQPLILKANSRLLDELMFNLIDNGIKYNKDGGNVTLHLSEEPNWCKITVTDTGIGISKEHQQRVFERFYRVDSSRSKKTGGTGLGLSIVKHITEHHNGKITVESTEGAGTTIICHIPLVQS
ncbi:MAG: ATP-binding protein [Defluviitaleaceae bacterium]|nr:ATP-binding protein [Defluviitaleaceae bacterium]